MTSYEKVVSIWKSWNVKTADQLTRCMNVSYVQGIHESNNIDSQEVDSDVAREVIVFGTVTRYTGSLLVLTELSNAAMCHKLLCKRFEEKVFITLDFVKEVHSTMMAGCYDRRRYIDLEERPGTFKRHDFVVGEDEIGVDPEDVEYELTELLDEMQQVRLGGLSAEEVLTAGAYMHAKFECIHPFADGNGRVGRLLLNYWLVSNGHPPITVFCEDKQSYFDALQQYVDSEDLTPLCSFLQSQTIKTWQMYAD